MSFLEHVTRVFILRMRSLGQNGPLRWNTVEPRYKEGRI